MAKKKSSTAKKPASKKGAKNSKSKPKKKKLGEWKVKRVADKEVLVKLPKGMMIDSDDPLNIEDLLSGIANYMVARKDPQIRCCSKKVMVA